MANTTIIRIDDRLIHGQVLVGWGSHYPIKHYIIGNDHIAENEWEKNLLLMAAPDDIDTRILSLRDTVVYIEKNKDVKEMSLVLIKSADDVMLMAKIGLPAQTINIGGIHYCEGREEYLPYIFLNKKEVEIFKELIRNGFVFICQDVPNSARYNLKSLLEKKTP